MPKSSARRDGTAWLLAATVLVATVPAVAEDPCAVFRDGVEENQRYVAATRAALADTQRDHGDVALAQKQLRLAEQQLALSKTELSNCQANASRRSPVRGPSANASASPSRSIDEEDRREAEEMDRQAARQAAKPKMTQPETPTTARPAMPTKDWLAVPPETLAREAAAANEPPPDPAYAKKQATLRQIAYSGLYCAFAGERAQNMAAIRELRGNMRMGGAVDAGDLKDYTDWVREAERNMKRIKAVVKKLLPCTNATVRSVAACGVPTQYGGVTGYENFTCSDEYKEGYSDYQAIEYWQ